MVEDQRKQIESWFHVEEKKMNYCCICGRDTNHKNSYHVMINNDMYHYCHWHFWIGKLLHKKFIDKKP